MDLPAITIPELTGLEPTPPLVSPWCDAKPPAFLPWIFANWPLSSNLKIPFETWHRDVSNLNNNCQETSNIIITPFTIQFWNRCRVWHEISPTSICSIFSSSQFEIDVEYGIQFWALLLDAEDVISILYKLSLIVEYMTNNQPVIQNLILEMVSLIHGVREGTKKMYMLQVCWS